MGVLRLQVSLLGGETIKLSQNNQYYQLNKILLNKYSVKVDMVRILFTRHSIVHTAHIPFLLQSPGFSEHESISSSENTLQFPQCIRTNKKPDHKGLALCL